jgi:hypothetical protein
VISFDLSIQTKRDIDTGGTVGLLGYVNEDDL